MNISIFTVDGREYSSIEAQEITFIQTAGVACDSLQFRFKKPCDVGEINKVKAYCNGALVFNGYCDCQKATSDKNGISCYVYARSSALLLVDNEAQPFTYNCPTTRQLWYSFARDFGFENHLPEIVCNEKYEVAKGSSCYGAISRFIELKADGVMHVTPQNELECLEASATAKNLNDLSLLSLTYTINRSEPITHYCVKRNNQQNGYTFHIKSRLGDELKISRRRYLNLQTLPQWQRDYAGVSKIKSSFADYKVIEAMVSGYVADKLFQRFDCSIGNQIFNDCLLTEKKYIKDKNGERTRLVLKNKTDIKEISYVD